MAHHLAGPLGLGLAALQFGPGKRGEYVEQRFIENVALHALVVEKREVPDHPAGFRLERRVARVRQSKVSRARRVRLNVSQRRHAATAV